MAQTYGNTWWGNSWLKSLSHIDYANRIPRGATYARQGNVKDIQINGNLISAKVAGSRPTPYRVSVLIPPFDDKQIARLMEGIIDRPALISKLLNRELDPDLLIIAERCGLKLFPSQWTDLKMNCNCPDWAVPCKHLAAVIYLMSREIDNNPFLVFEMHNVHLFDELKKRGIAIEKTVHLDVPLLADLFVRRKNGEQPAAPPTFERIDFSGLRPIADALIGLLPASPAFYNQGDFLPKYEQMLLRTVKNAQRVMDRKLSLETAFGCLLSSRSISHRDEIGLTITDQGNAIPAYPAQGAGADKKTALFTVTELPAALFALPADFLADYSPAVSALHQAFLFALHLLANGAVVPQIVQLANRQYLVRWHPACLDPNVQEALTALERILPENIIHASVGGRKTPFALANQAACLVSHFLTQLVHALSGDAKGDLLIEMFFAGHTPTFSGVGEQGTAGSVKSWTDRYLVTSRRYTPVFLIREIESDCFLLDISLEDTTQPLPESIPLHDVLTDQGYAKSRFGILKELSMLSGLLPGLNDYINTKAMRPISYNSQTMVPFLLKTVPIVRLLNIKVLLPKSLQQLLRPKPSLRLTKKSSDQESSIRLDELLSFDWQIAIGDEVLSPEAFRELTTHAAGLIRFKQNYIYVDGDDLEKIYKSFAQPPRFSNARLLQVALTEEYDAAPIQLSNEVRELIRELTVPTCVPLPTGICATLRPYQERGYSWMYRNLRIGFGCIMADDMGLGKTLQVITLLQKVKEEGGLQKKKVLIIAPTGLLINWQMEIERFAPSLSVFIYHGQGRDLNLFNSDLLLTSYGTLRSDVALLKKKKWQLMIIDEAQNIKNQDTAQSKAVRSIPAATHIAMSGTPVENRLSEFWTIMDFANKGYLDTIKHFQEEYARPIQLSNDRRCVERFRKITAPFMMRRLKSDKTVITDLPDKIEQNEYALLTPRQTALYQQTLQAAMQEIEGVETTDSAALFKRQGLVLQMILALKQICNHPTQFLKNGEFVSALSGKTELLLDLVESIVANGEKVLIFTQFTEMGEMLQRFIEERLGERPMFYHGSCSVKQRQEMVDRFQTNRADKVFLLSLKAAGTGLNLTAASHVVHYDLWWNPAVEAQATDRAYRIGQQNKVMVHRFITKNTFEERIDEMIQRKKLLADLTVTAGENWIGKLSNQELKALFQ